MKIKKIIINSNNDYINLIKKLKYYRSILYSKTKFVIVNNIDAKYIDIICKALNIKSRKKRIDYIYDTACKIIDDNAKNINMCGFKNNKCYSQQKLSKDKYNGCCRSCIYQTDKGCSTKNLSCKLFNCSEVKKRYKVIELEDLEFLEILNKRQRSIIKSDFFSKREEVLKDLYSYSILYSYFRISIRFIVNSTRLFIKKHITQN